jgi:hypothetical protein
MNRSKLTVSLRIVISALLVVVYTLFLKVFISEADGNSFITIWITGGLLYVLAIIYSLMLRDKPWLLGGLFVFGLVWVFPPFLFTVFGIPFLALYPIFIVSLVIKEPRCRKS